MTNYDDWINRGEYPFSSHHLTLPIGNMHYVDEGEGEPLLMVHGNPTWFFVYRNLIKALLDRFRCIAIDNIGFGLSDKPNNWSCRPVDHVENLSTLVQELGLNNIT